MSTLPNTVTTYNGKTIETKGKVLLIVNMASGCGLCDSTLPKLFELCANNPEVVCLLYPSNDFNQEPKSEEEIMTYLTETFGTLHPNMNLMSKIRLRGESTDPMYSYLINNTYYLKIFSAIRWNYEKFVVCPDGHIERFSPLDSMDQVGLFIQGFI